MPSTSAARPNTGETPPPERGEHGIRERADACPGALRLHQAEDGQLARLRLPGGRLTEPQAAVLGDAAARLADGHLSITSRGNVELRGLDDGYGQELAELLTDAGLLPSPQHERIRNVLVSPLSGLDPAGHADAYAWAAELDALLCGSTRAPSLSGRFLFALDDGRCDVAGLGADVTLIARPGGTAALCLAEGVWDVAGADAPRAALVAAEAFLTAAEGTGAWRVRDLPPGRVPDVTEALRAAGVGARAGERPAGPAARWAAGPPAGVVTGPGPGGTRGDGHDRADTGAAVCAHPRLGRVSVPQWSALLPAPGGEIRLTPWRGVVVPGFAGPAAAEARLRVLGDIGYVTRSDDPWYGVGACTGRGCARSRSDVRADVVPLPRGADPGVPAGLPVYWSGCERRCGRPQGDWVDVLATADGYRTTVHRDDATVHRDGTPPAGAPGPARASTPSPTR